MLSQTLFITIIDLIDAQLFADYLKSFEGEGQVSDMLNEVRLYYTLLFNVKILSF
jgi:hypothetical protein